VTAWLALVLSIISLGWQVVQMYIRWPRIGVVVWQHAYLGTEGNWEKFDVVIVNNGAEAASIATVGIRSQDGSRTLDVERIRDSGTEVDGPDLPARVEAHGALRWVIGPELLKAMPQGTQVVGYAYRFQTFRKWPKKRRTPIRVIETVIAATRNCAPLN
jgi:hypothetical protein